MARQTPDPFKKLRFKQATDAKELAAKNKQRAGILKEQEKIRAAEATEKKANEDRLKTPPPPRDTTSTRPLPDPLQTATQDPEIIPEAGGKAAETDTTAAEAA